MAGFKVCVILYAEKESLGMDQDYDTKLTDFRIQLFRGLC